MVGALRIACCVPFCRRWRHGDPAHGDWICWEHWKRIPLKRRRAYFRAIAERMPAWLAESDRQRPPRWMLPRAERVQTRPRYRSAAFRLWGRMKRDAIARGL